MKITVILCTYNRCASLEKALQSVAESSLHESTEWEVLVVDNNSRDQTREVIENFCRRFPGRFRYLFEPKPGKSNALNSGIQAANGDVLAFMDDDVIVDPSWLHNLTDPLRDATCAGTGGRIFPQWTSPPPPWVRLDGREYSLAPLAAFDLGPEAHVLNEAPFGTSMAFRKEIFERYGGFRTDLGPRPGTMVRSEDTEFGKRLLDAGERLLYEPSAIVHHEVSPNRLKKEYFLGWWLDKGRADIRESGIPSNTKFQVLGIPVYLFRRLMMGTLRWLMTVNPATRFSRKIKVWGLWGQISECHRQSLDQSRANPIELK